MSRLTYGLLFRAHLMR